MNAGLAAPRSSESYAVFGANMKASVSVGGRPKKGDCRTTWNWVGKLDMKATVDGDQFLLAAINRAMFGNEDEAKALRKALIAEGDRCQRDHEKRVKSSA